MTDLPISKEITIKVGNITGGPIDTFEWKIDDVPQTNNTDTLTILPNTLSLGLHNIKFRGKNYCGNWSSEIIERINIIKGDIMENTVSVIVDRPLVQVTIVLPYTGTIEVTVTDGINPVEGANLQLDGVDTGLITGVDGKASILNIPYSTTPHAVKAIKA